MADKETVKVVPKQKQSPRQKEIKGAKKILEKKGIPVKSIQKESAKNVKKEEKRKEPSKSPFAGKKPSNNAQVVEAKKKPIIPPVKPLEAGKNPAEVGKMRQVLRKTLEQKTKVADEKRESLGKIETGFKSDVKELQGIEKKILAEKDAAKREALKKDLEKAEAGIVKKAEEMRQAQRDLQKAAEEEMKAAEKARESEKEGSEERKEMDEWVQKSAKQFDEVFNKILPQVPAPMPGIRELTDSQRTVLGNMKKVTEKAKQVGEVAEAKEKEYDQDVASIQYYNGLLNDGVDEERKPLTPEKKKEYEAKVKKLETTIEDKGTQLAEAQKAAVEAAEAEVNEVKKALEASKNKSREQMVQRGNLDRAYARYNRSVRNSSMEQSPSSVKGFGVWGRLIQALQTLMNLNKGGSSGENWGVRNLYSGKRLGRGRTNLSEQDLDALEKSGGNVVSEALKAFRKGDIRNARHCTDWVSKIYGRSVHSCRKVFDRGFSKETGPGKRGTGLIPRGYASRTDLSKLRAGCHVIVDHYKRNQGFGQGKTHSVILLEAPVNGYAKVVSYPGRGRKPRVETYDLLGRGGSYKQGKAVRAHYPPA